MHIIVISKLYKGTPSKWLEQIAELRDDKKSALAVYAPLRNAIVEEINSEGAGQEVLANSFRFWQKTPALESIRSRSQNALEIFRRDVRGKITTLDESFLSRSYPSLACSVRDDTKKKSSLPSQVYKIEGRFHFSFISSAGRLCYAYIHCSSWPNARKEAFVELLHLLARSNYKCSREDVWFIDLSGAKAKVTHPSRQGVGVQKEIIKVLRLLSQVHQLSEEVLSDDQEY